ncbi:hypothetical protein [Helicobacter japonicus]|nr:hypothetical protein [Helicobacter japonicus]
MHYAKILSQISNIIYLNIAKLNKALWLRFKYAVLHDECMLTLLKS